MQLSKIVRVEADVMHWDGAKPRSIDEILRRSKSRLARKVVPRSTKFLSKVRPTPA